MVTGPFASEAFAVPVLAVVVSAGYSRTRLTGAVRDGAVVSRTIMVWTALELLPLKSVAVHLRMIPNVAPHPLVVTSLKLIVTAPLASVAVAVPRAFVPVLAGYSRTTLAGLIIPGAVVSLTVIVWTALAVFPHGSVDVHVRVITCDTPPPA